MAKAADEALRLEVKTRELHIDYVAGKKTIEDHVYTFAMLEKQGKLTRQKVVSEVKTGAGNMRIESKSGATCFVATATYGDADHPNVRFLRAFRDDCLVRTSIGRTFIGWYWVIGPKLASQVCKYSLLRSLSHASISLLVIVIKLFTKVRSK